MNKILIRVIPSNETQYGIPIIVFKATLGVYTVTPRFIICLAIYVNEAKHLTNRLLNL